MNGRRTGTLDKRRMDDPNTWRITVLGLEEEVSIETHSYSAGVARAPPGRLAVSFILVSGKARDVRLLGEATEPLEAHSPAARRVPGAPALYPQPAAPPRVDHLSEPPERTSAASVREVGNAVLLPSRESMESEVAGSLNIELPMAAVIGAERHPGDGLPAQHLEAAPLVSFNARRSEAADALEDEMGRLLSELTGADVQSDASPARRPDPSSIVSDVAQSISVSSSDSKTPIQLSARRRRDAQPGWLAENIPRKMRAHVAEEIEIRLSQSSTSRLLEAMRGRGDANLREVAVTNAMSLRLTAPKGEFLIDAHSPETQWVFINVQSDGEEFAAWCYTITPLHRGIGVLRLTLSHKQVGPDGLIADRTLPDQSVDINVRANVGRVCIGAAGWTATLVAGAALGAYFDDLLLLIRNLS